MQPTKTILAVEPELIDATNLTNCLVKLGVIVRTATLVEQTMQFLRGHIFDAAVVAAELSIDHEPMLAYLRRLPTIETIVATGPGNDWELERRARLAGADAYLPRPVSPEMLEMVLGRPVDRLAPNESRRAVAGF